MFGVGLQRINEKQHKVVITDRMWARLLSSTNQPSFITNKEVIEYRKEHISGEEKNEETQLLDDQNCADVAPENVDNSFP